MRSDISHKFSGNAKAAGWAEDHTLSSKSLRQSGGISGVEKAATAYTEFSKLCRAIVQ